MAKVTATAGLWNQKGWDPQYAEISSDTGINDLPNAEIIGNTVRSVVEKAWKNGQDPADTNFIVILKFS